MDSLQFSSESQVLVHVLPPCMTFVFAPDGGDNDIQVFVDNVRQQSGSSKAYTLGFDGSSEFKRITFTNH